jgi:hypothetical protein
MDMNQYRQNPVMFYLRTLTYTLIALCLRLVMLAPLLLLLLPQGSPWRWGALLCPLMLIFVVLPMRYSFADALVQKPRQRFFSFDAALGTQHYGEKLCESLLHLLSVAKWGLPLVGMLAFAGWYYLYPLGESAAELLALLREIGQWGANLWYTVIDAFTRLFGGTPGAHLDGGWIEGLYVLGGALAIGLLILLYGIVRNSCNRYIWVAATREERTPRTEIRRRMRGRRWKQLLVALGNLVLLLPWLVIAFLHLQKAVPSVSQLLGDWMVKGDVMTMDLTGITLPLVLAFLLLYLPLLPVRRILTAMFSAARQRHVAQVKTAEADSAAARSLRAAQETSDVPMVEAPVVPEWVKRESTGFYPQNQQSVEE